jgi:hypothetical protein
VSNAEMPPNLEPRKNAHPWPVVLKRIRLPLARVATASTVRRAAGSGPRSCSPMASGKAWSSSISWGGRLRFSQICRLLPSVTRRMLTNQLRELEADGFVERRVYAAGHRAFGAALLKVRLTVPSPDMLTTTSSCGAGHCVWTRLPVRTISPARNALPRSARLLASHAKAL